MFIYIFTPDEENWSNLEVAIETTEEYETDDFNMKFDSFENFRRFIETYNKYVELYNDATKDATYCGPEMYSIKSMEISINSQCNMNNVNRVINYLKNLGINVESSLYDPDAQ